MAGGVWRGEDAGPSSGRKTSPEQGPYNDLEVALSEGGALSGFGRREGMADYLGNNMLAVTQKMKYLQTTF